jgi:DNA-binding MarR family transcriptional regulator
MANELEISEKEYAVINEIHKNHLPDQRTIATRTGISLGLTNLIIKKLIKKGYIKAKQLNQKKIQYLLTPMGFTEKARKSYNFTLKTINMLAGIRKGIQNMTDEYIYEGYDHFEVFGKGEIVHIIELSLSKKSGISYEIKAAKNDDANSAVLTVTSTKTGATKSVDMIEYLSNSGIIVW